MRIGIGQLIILLFIGILLFGDINAILNKIIAFLKQIKNTLNN